MTEERLFDEWGQRIEIWPTEAVCISIAGPRGGHMATLRLDPAVAHELALALMSVAKQTREEA